MLDLTFEEDEQAQEDDTDGIAVGIDLGTTNTVVAHSDEQGPVALRDARGGVLQPSVVSFLRDGTTAVGQDARARRQVDPENTIFSLKRIIGQPFSSPRLQRAIADLPYRIVEGENQEPLVRTRDEDFTVPDISAKVIAHVREIAMASRHRPVTHCVITVPANFNDAQREATRRAVNAGGLEVLRILNEPTAAALAYGRGRPIDQRIAVFDMGGGTFDLSVLVVRRGLYEVLATGGDPFLGGDDMDHVLADELANRCLQKYQVDPSADPLSLAKLLTSAEEIKRALSKDESTDVQIGPLVHGAGGQPFFLETTVTRAEFEDLVSPIVERAISCAEGVLAEADLLPQHVDEVLLVGGGTNVPMVQQRISEFFGRPANASIDPMRVVALGAAAHAQNLYAPETLGPDAQFSSPGSETDESDLSAPIRAQTALLLDVTSHALGLATAGGFAEVLIEKNTQIPAEITRTFGTAHDNQERVALKVCQGDDPRFDNNDPLGELTLDGLRPAARGEVEIEVSFLINADGLLKVSAKDRATGAETSANLSLLGLNDA